MTNLNSIDASNKMLQETNSSINLDSEASITTASTDNKAVKEDTLSFKSLKFRILGYYNYPNQKMKEEEDYPQEALDLAELLKKSISSLYAMEDMNREINGFVSACRGKAVIIFKDEKNRLYAYWPHDNIARLSNVNYSSNAIIQVSFILKSWFIPGEPIVLNKSLLSFFDYVRANIDKGENVSLKVLGSTNIVGAVKVVGSDFLVITNPNEELVISNSIILKKKKLAEVSSSQLSNDEEDNYLEANGYIQQFTKRGGIIFEYSSQRSIPFYRDRNAHLSDMEIKINAPIIFKLFEKDNWKEAHFICPVKVSDACSLFSKCKASGDKFQKKAANFIKKKLKNEFPNDPMVLSILQEQSNEKEIDTEINQIHLQANEYIANKNFEKAVSILSTKPQLLPELCKLYITWYNDDTTDEEEKEIIQAKILDFIDQNDQRLSAENIGLRKNLLFTVGKIDLFVKYIDKTINQCESNRTRALLFTQKALLIDNNKKEYIECLSESLAANPWYKNADKLLNDQLGYTEEQDRTTFIAVPSNYLSNSKDIFLKNLFNDYNEYENEITNRKDIESKQDTSRVNTSDFNNYTLKLIQSYKGSIPPGKLLAQYCCSRAIALARENGDLNSIRYLLQKSLTYIEGFGYFVRRTLYIYIQSLTYRSGWELFTSIPIPTKPLDSEAFTKALLSLSQECHKDWMTQLACIMHSNDSVKRQLKRILFKDEELKRNTIEYFEDSSQVSIGEDFKEYEDKWEKLVDKINQKHINQTKGLKEWGENDTSTDLETGISIMKDIASQNLSVEEKNITNRLVLLFEDGLKMLKAQDIASKQRKALEIIDKRKVLIEQTMAIPTRITCLLLPVINKLINFIDENYQKTRNSFTNKITVNPISPNVAIIKKGQRHSAHVILEVYNEVGGLPISDVYLTITRYHKDNDLPDFENNRPYPISSGDSWECRCNLDLTPNEIENEYFEFEVSLNYVAESDGREHNYSKKIKINLYREENFKPIPNPYLPASGKALQESNKEMFFGRTDILNELDNAFRCNNSYRHFIIYGQKRCGKSSLRYMLARRLSDCNDLLIVSFQLSNEITDEYDFYREILNQIILQLTNDPKETIQRDTLDDIRKGYSSVEFFQNRFIALKKHEKWGGKRLLLMIDEFTSIYDGIKSHDIKNTILKDWKRIAEDANTQFGAILFGHDVTPMFLAEDYNRNATAILEQRQLTYLKVEEAKALITEPVLDDKGYSRYMGKSVTRIMEYTGKSPYYIQIFCHFLINYINKHRSYRITLTDIEEVAEILYKGSNDEDPYFSSINDWDNLINNGLHTKWNKYHDDEIVRVLHTIAVKSNKEELCKRSDIHLNIDDYPELTEETLNQRIDGILDELTKRAVIERSMEHYYGIKVLLFKKWLINNHLS